MGISFPKVVTRKSLLISSAVIFGVSLCIGILIGALGIGSQTEQHTTAKRDVSPQLKAAISAKAIDENLRFLTKGAHVAGTAQDLEQANWVRDHFLEHGLDKVEVVPYQVLLSYPDKRIPNRIYILDPNGSVNFSTSGYQKPLFSPEESDESLMPSFNAYSAPGTVIGDLVYAYYGRNVDLDLLAARGIEIRDKIVLARLGKTYRGNIVRNAQLRGAAGVIMYGDPKDFAPEGRKNVYPNSWWMPGTAVQSGTLLTRNGDPLTPFLPAIESAYRLSPEEAEVPKIPVQSIGYDDAEVLLKALSQTNPAPEEWQGNLEVPYYLGPGLAERGWKVKLEVHTSNQMATTYNTIGYLYGDEEPDRYVLLGNHRDSWIFGAQDPSSGTASMMEAARAFGSLKEKSNWRPRRTLVFCSWGAEEYIIIGSYEWVEEHFKVLSQRAVAYLNVDTALEGNYSFSVSSVPTLQNVALDVAKEVANPDPEQVRSGRLTLYDTWVARNPDSANPTKPRIGNLGSGTDYAPFIHSVGIPSMDFYYDYKKDVEMYQYPLYHTLYETYHAVKLMDPDTEFLRSVAEFWSLVAVRLADSEILPFDVHLYAKHLKSSLLTFKHRYEKRLEANNATFKYFTKAVEEFETAAADFTSRLKKIDMSKPLEVRKVNDQLMQLERAFIDPKGLPNRPQYSHIVFAPSTSNSYASSSFAGFADLMEEIGSKSETEAPKLWTRVKQHLALIAFYIQAAAASLYDL